MPELSSGWPGWTIKFWKAPHEKLLEVIDCDAPADRPKVMKQYLEAWYPAMKGQAAFRNGHTKPPKSGITGYFAYWAMYSGAFAYLLGIDDTSHRDEEVYPKDLVDHARRRPRPSAHSTV